MIRKRIHLVCNAHLNPVWLWHWEDGLTEALSTHRIAADFCEGHEDFVFNYNEALLYRWAQEYEPQLFKRIETLVRKGQWETAGGSSCSPTSTTAPARVTSVSSSSAGSISNRLSGDTPARRTTPILSATAKAIRRSWRVVVWNGMSSADPTTARTSCPWGPSPWRDRSGHEVVTRRSDDHYLTNGDFVERARTHLPHFDPEPVS